MISTLYEGDSGKIDKACNILTSRKFHVCQQSCLKNEEMREKFLTTCRAASSLFQSEQVADFATCSVNNLLQSNLHHWIPGSASGFRLLAPHHIAWPSLIHYINVCERYR